MERNKVDKDLLVATNNLAFHSVLQQNPHLVRIKINNYDRKQEFSVYMALGASKIKTKDKDWN